MTNPPPDAPLPDSPPPSGHGLPGGDPAAAYPPPPAASQSAPAYSAPGSAPPSPDYAAPAAPTSPPGRVLSIVGLVLAFLLPPIGLILSIIAAVQLGKAGAPKGLAIAGIVVGAVLTILEIIGIILLVTVFAGIIGMCAELGPGVWDVGGVTYRCG